MVVLLSNSDDASIDYVISWLKFFNHEYLRINADEIVDNKVYISITEKKIIYKNINICIDDINAIWFRKFGFINKTNYYKLAKQTLGVDELQHIVLEFRSILLAFISAFKKKKWLTPPEHTNLNKLDMLFLAKECGLDIPESYIVSNKKQLLSLQNKFKKIYISKSVYEPHFIHVSNGVFSMFTKEIVDMDKIPEAFFPSLIQEKILKKYELRIFYIDGEFFTMAIFSQGNKKTELDFRNYDLTNLNRQIPYNLPCAIKEKLKTMLSKIGLNCCSIDIIKSSTDEKYYFLEINPTGQFGMISIPCNYELFKKIAITLIEMDKK